MPHLHSRLAACIGALAFSLSSPAWCAGFQAVDLVSDDPATHPAQITDTGLKNGWGMSLSATSPFWVSSNGAGTSTLYSVNPTTQATAKLGLTVTIPGNGSVTGQVFNSNASAGAFNGDNFLFVSEDGTVSGWRGALGTSAEALSLASASAVYKGSAFASIGGNSYLYAANFHTGAIDVLGGSAGTPALPGSFVDPSLPSGFAPFNVQNLGGTLFVTYAKQDANAHDEVVGAGLGIVDRFDPQGNFLGRVATGGALNAPWGLAIAPSSFGALAGALLVGNFGDGRINAYDAGSSAFLGQITGSNGDPLTIDGLWALSAGNGGNGGSASMLYFTAGPDGESHGVFGVLAAVPEPATALLWSAGLVLSIAWARRRSRAG